MKIKWYGTGKCLSQYVTQSQHLNNNNDTKPQPLTDLMRKTSFKCVILGQWVGNCQLWNATARLKIIMCVCSRQCPWQFDHYILLVYFFPLSGHHDLSQVKMAGENESHILYFDAHSTFLNLPPSKYHGVCVSKLKINNLGTCYSTLSLNMLISIRGNKLSHRYLKQYSFTLDSLGWSW